VRRGTPRDYNAVLLTAKHVLVPPALTAGSRIRVIAPAGPFDRTLVLRGMGWLAERYRVEFDPGLFARSGFLAGSDERRLAELNAALGAEGVRAIVAARGGYGSTRILPRADFRALRDEPKWIVGFSDITALHVRAARAGVASLHAHNAAGLGRADVALRRRFVHALEQPLAEHRYEGLPCWNGGTATGPLAGGNLTLLFTCAADRSLFIPDGAVLVLEDVTESSYRLDRMLTALIDSGALDRVAAVVLGEFADCTPGKHGVPIDRVLHERLAQLRVPVVAGFPCGHGVRNDPLPFGLPALVDASAGYVVVCPSEVLQR
jgi:muramoyltetrapeptide carboxypeptidase